MNRVCKKCGEEKALDAFPIYARATGARRHECTPCHKARMQVWYAENQDDVLQHRAKEYAKRPFKVWTDAQIARKNEVANRKNAALRDVVYTAYGSQCECCGEANAMFLTVDHVNNDGFERRKVHGSGSSFYRWIIKQGYPTDLQLLCYNCNIGKARNGGTCPHVFSEGSTIIPSGRRLQVSSRSARHSSKRNDDMISPAVKAVAVCPKVSG